MRTRRRQDSGFTLLELMFSLLIIGIMLGLGTGFLNFSSSRLGDTARDMAALFSRARVDAMLSRHKVELVFDGNRIFRNGDGADKLVRTLPSNLQLAIDGKALMMSGKEHFVFSPLGYTRERLLLLHDGMESFSIYVPAIGAPVARRGLFDLEEIRREKP